MFWTTQNKVVPAFSKSSWKIYFDIANEWPGYKVYSSPVFYTYIKFNFNRLTGLFCIKSQEIV